MTNDETLELLVRVDERLARVETGLDEVRHALLGNGRPGVISDLATLTERVRTLETRKSESVAGRWALYAALATGTFSCLEMLVRHLHV